MEGLHITGQEETPAHLKQLYQYSSSISHINRKLVQGVHTSLQKYSKIGTYNKLYTDLIADNNRRHIP